MQAHFVRFYYDINRGISKQKLKSIFNRGWTRMDTNFPRFYKEAAPTALGGSKTQADGARTPHSGFRMTGAQINSSHAASGDGDAK
jgi:hypothetical protein